MSVSVFVTHVPRGSVVDGVCRASIEAGHYLHKMPDPRTSFEIYAIHTVVNISGKMTARQVGFLVFGRPQATRCRDWYGSVEDVKSSRCEVTRWQVLNLARVWIAPQYQPGGDYFESRTPGYYDRSGAWRSTLASTAINAWCKDYAQDYLVRRPPVFLDEPYELAWLMSYCDTKLHRGTIYRAAGFELYATNENGIQTFRKPLRGMTIEEQWRIVETSAASERSNRIRAQRAQLSIFSGETV